MPRPASRNEVVVIMWRDIPAQVNGQSGRSRHQVVLTGKFQRAIDRAKRKAGIVTAQEDIAQWRRLATPCDGDPAIEAATTAKRLHEDYTLERLGRLAANGGFERAAGDDG